ncbi:MAG TPA: tetratricopeptide repeat protein [Thermoanaerobaculia bacterium]|nr:tetratricopeptide repeat protein [Thermoanaerobaculia bacterium]
MKIHPHDKVLESFLLSLAERDLDLVFHLARCSYCRSRIYYLPRPVETVGEGEAAGGYGPTLEPTREPVESWARAVEAERDEAPELFVELMGHQAGRWDEVLGADSRFHSWGLFELLIERSWETTAQDTLHAEELARLALRLGERLDPARYGAELIEDLKARAWAHIGNACRTRSDLYGAEAAFFSAVDHLDKGTGDAALERAILLDLLGSLRRDQRQFQEAVDLLRKAVAAFLKIGDRHRAGRSLINSATVHYHAGNPEESIPVLYESLDLIDADQEPRLLICARHNLATYLADAGRAVEARDLYRETRPLYRDFAEPFIQNRRQWLKGKIVRGLGNAARAESLFLKAREGFLAEGIPYDTALISLELATLYAEQGRTADLKRLAEEIVPVFASRKIHREALAALAFLKQAIEAEAASLEVIARVAAFLKRAENDPGLKFET